MPATYSPDDYWGAITTLFTGYSMPDRAKLFEKLVDTHGVPLMRVEIDDMRYDNGGGANAGWLPIDGDQDYNLFFAPKDGVQNQIAPFQVRIWLMGASHGTNRFGFSVGKIAGGGGLGVGGGSGKIGETDYSAADLFKWVGGSRSALLTLQTNHTTRGFQYDGVTVADADAVDLRSFDITALAFDRSHGFFAQQADVLAAWEKSLGGEHSSWHGKAAGVFWNLVHHLHTNYESYVTQQGGRNYKGTNTTVLGYVPRSKFADAVAGAQKHLAESVDKMNNAWTSWASEGKHDPYWWALNYLDQIAAWSSAHNIGKLIPAVRLVDGQLTVELQPAEGFEATNPMFGDPKSYDFWKALGQRALSDWNNHTDTELANPAKVTLSGLASTWLADAGNFDFGLEDKDTSPLSSGSSKDGGDGGLDDLKKKMGQGFKGLGNGLNGLGNGLNGLGNGLNGLGNNFKGLGNNLNTGLNNLGNGFKNNFNNLGLGLGNGLNQLGTGLKGLGDGFNSSFTNLGAGLGNGFNQLGSGLNGLGSNLGGIGGILGGLGGGTGGNSLLGNNDLGGALTPGGGRTHLNPDGTISTTFPDGTVQTIDPKTGKVTTKAPDGTIKTSQLHDSQILHNPDGSTTVLNPDGTLTTSYRDGTTTTLDPTTGHLTTTNPDGTKTTQDLLHPAQSGSGSAGNFHLTLPKGFGSTSGLLSGHSNNFAGTGGSSGAGQSYEEYDSSPLGGGALGAPGVGAGMGALSSSGGMGGMPMGGMPMSGPAGGAGGGGGNSGERLRNVLTDSSGPTNRRGTKSRTSSTGDDENDLVVNKSRTPTTSGASPTDRSKDSRKSGRSVQSVGPARVNWDTEDDDVWGAEEGGAPAVLGR
ncbi:AAWKG family protein (plasmid) [Streptomyces sp. AHU1]|uniref:AAWKG family protein n=1 Tax=Streptomyces sp. AHU1 TaxID=3377215 RepID=UPI00387839E8